MAGRNGGEGGERKGYDGDRSGRGNSAEGLLPSGRRSSLIAPKGTA